MFLHVFLYVFLYMCSLNAHSGDLHGMMPLVGGICVPICVPIGVPTYVVLLTDAGLRGVLPLVGINVFLYPTTAIYVFL